jgi:cyclopropane fatty-acyl-phospholipid synthase-like methyltransferase
MSQNNHIHQSDTRLKNNKDTSELDSFFIMKYADKNSDILDLGSGGGLIVNKLYNKVRTIVALDLFKEFTKFIVKSDNVKIVNTNLFDYSPSLKFDVITIFGVMHYFNEDEAIALYKKYYSYIKDKGKIIIKNQFGLASDVTISEISKELKKEYFAQYRCINKEVRILKNIGFKDIEWIDIYLPEYNKWENTHYYAIVGTKT